jgi:hypothetical protein
MSTISIGKLGVFAIEYSLKIVELLSMETPQEQAVIKTDAK